MTLPILALPGLACTQAVWTPALDAVGAPVVALDYPTHDDLGAMAQDVLGRGPERFIAVGHSMGGYLAYEILRQAPERVAGLVVISAPVSADSAEQAAMRDKAVARARSQGMTRFADQLGRFLMHKEAEGLPRFVAMAESVGIDRFAAHQRAIAGRPDSHALLGALACPTTVVVGDADPLMTVEAARAITVAIKVATLVVVPRCGHITPIEAPDAVGLAVKALLDRIGGASH